MECGIACLRMVCGYFGREYSAESLSRLCPPTVQGVSLYALSEAAGAVGLHSVCGRASLDMLRRAPLPCILHWDQNHFVVLYRIRRGRFLIADPGKGFVSYTENEMYDHWISTSSAGEEKGVGMFVQPTPSFYGQKGERGTERRSFRFLMGYVRQYRRYFGQIAVGLLVASLLQLIFPFLTQAIVDVGIAHRDIGFIYLILLAQLMLTLSRTALDFIRRQLLLHISMRINISLVSDFFIKLLRLPMSFFDTKLLGDLLQRMNDHARVEKFLTTQALNVMFSLFGFIVFGAVLFIYSRLIFAVFLVGSLLYGLWITLFMRRRKALDYRLFEQQAINSSKTYQFITSMQEIKLQDCEQRRRWEWEDVQADMFDVNMQSLRLQQAQEAGSIFINEIKNIVITVLAATAVIGGQMTLGMMLAVQYIIGQLNAPVEQLMGFIYSLQDVQISLERINEIHAKENEDALSGTLRTLPDPAAGIVLSRVDFKYDINRPDKTLDSISLTIPAGKVTAIVGASGSGKTTLVKLLLGYYPPIAGKITVGGEDIRKYDIIWWRRQCGVVMQDGVIFSESIARNIAVDDGEIDTSRLAAAARIACISSYINSLPLKYNTVIGQDGVGLSAGQRQRILIARAVYKNPAFILLDEATNSLDANNERAIVENLDSFYRGRTVLVVAHRLSTVSHADNIVVLDHGRIVEQGSHEELTARRGAYYNLVKNQLELGN